MDTESYTSNDFRKRIEQLSKSLENRIKSRQNKSKFYFTEEDDEILDSNAMELSSEPETWLYASDQCATGEESRLGNRALESMSASMLNDEVSNVINQSRRCFDSRTYTRPKKQSRPFITSQDSLSATFRTDCTTKSGSPFGGPHLAHLNHSTDNTMESSLGIIDINNLSESQQLDYEKSSMEPNQSSSSMEDGSPQIMGTLNATYEKNNSTLCIASDAPLNSTFTLLEDPENSPPARQNSKFAQNCLPEPSYNSKLTGNRFPESSYSSKLARNQLSNTDKNSTFEKILPDPLNSTKNSKFANTQLPDPSNLTLNSTSTITLNSKYRRSQSPEPSALSYSSKLLRNQSPEPSPIWQNSKFSKKPLSESTPLVKNSRFTGKFTTNNRDNVEEGEEEKTEGVNGEVFLDSDNIMNVSFPSGMMQSSTSLQNDFDNTFEVNPNTTIDKKRSSFGAGRLKNFAEASVNNCEENVDLNVTVEKRRASEVNPNLTIDKRRGSDVNPNLTIEKNRISLGRCESMENSVEPEVDTSTPIERRNNFEVNPNLTIEKRRTSLGQGRSTTFTEDSPSLGVNPNATIEKIGNNFEVNTNNTTIDRRRSTLRSSTTTEDSNFDNFEVDPNTTIEKRSSNFEVNPNTTIEKRSSNFEVNPNTTIEKRSSNFEVNPNTTIEKRSSNFEVNPNTTIEKRSSNFEVNPNTTIERRSSNFEVNPNTTIEKRSSNFEVNPNTTIEKRSRNFEINPNTTIEKRSNNFEVNPNRSIEKVDNSRKSTIIGQQLKSSSTENVILNNVNANYQECLENSEKIQALRDRLGGTEEHHPPGVVSAKNLSQITPPHAEEFLGEPVSFSTPSRGGQNQKSATKSTPKLTNGDSSSTECEEFSPVTPRASSVPPPLDGTFCKSGGDNLSKKAAKLMEGGTSPLNSTFRKQALSSTFCKSAETLNNGVVGGGGGGSAESGPDEDGMSTASDSSFSSSSTHMRSVGEIQSIARLQEESLSLQNNTALRKIAWGGSDSGDGDLTKGNQTAFRKQTMSDDGNQSDHSSERCSPSSERCSPTALNNNLRNVSRLSLKPLSSYSRTSGLSMMQHARSVEQLPSALALARSKQSTTFGLKRPTVVSKQQQQPPPHNRTTSSLQQQPAAAPPSPPPPASCVAPPPPSSRLQAPTANKPSGIRPPTAIPRPVSRLPAPKIKTGLPRYNGKSSGQS